MGEIEKNRDLSAIISFNFFAGLTALLLFVSGFYGIIYLFIYYQLSFSIPIFQMVESTEVLFVAPSSILGLIIVIIPLGMHFGEALILPKFSDKLLERLRLTVIVLSSLGILGLFSLFIAKEFQKFNAGSGWYIIILRVVQLFFFCLPFLIADRSPIRIKALAASKANLYSFLAIAILSLPVFNGLADVAKIRNSKPILTYRLKIKDEGFLICKSQYKVIGKTNKYWFIYNTKCACTRIIKDEDVIFSDVYAYDQL